MSAAKKSNGASNERLGKHEKVLLSTIFFIREAEPGPISYSTLESALRLYLRAAKIDANKKELRKYKRSFLRYLRRKGYIRFEEKLHPVLRYRYPIVTQKGIEAGREAARKFAEKDIVYMAVERLKMYGTEWTTIQEIMDKVWEISREKKLFNNREEFKKYWTKRRLGIRIKELGVKQKHAKINGKWVKIYLF